jgi:hypothetical protein
VVAGNPARVVRRLEGSERGEAGQQQQQQQAGQPPPQAQPAAQA